MVRCINCKKVSRAYPGKCWKMWRLCGQCALNMHPESYPKRNFAKQSEYNIKIKPVRDNGRKKILDIIN